MRGGRIGFMQGRLSPQVDGKIQAFPWRHWREEFALAQSAGFGLMEWTLDAERLYENPVMTMYGEWLASGVANYLPVVNGSSNAIPQSGVELQIGLICSGTTASLLINDAVIRNADVSRFELANGKVGLAASSYENTPVIVSFDWFKVSEP